MVKLFKYSIEYILTLSLFLEIFNHKNYLFNKNELGEFPVASVTKEKGYFSSDMMENMNTEYFQKKSYVSKSNSTSLKNYTRILIFKENGFCYIGSVSNKYPLNPDSIEYYNHKNLHLNFQKNLINKNSEYYKKTNVYNSAIYKIINNKVSIQYYYGTQSGDYDLMEIHGEILKDGSMKFYEQYNYRNKSLSKIDLVYNFKNYKVYDIPNYFEKNKKKFWK